MAAKKVGTLIKEARAEAGLTQEALARKIDGVSASDISKVEHGEKDLTQAQLKQAAKALGITQTSLLNAPKNVKTGTAGKTSSSKKKTSAKTTSVKLTASEKKLVELYRKAGADERKAAVNMLKGVEEAGSIADFFASIFEGAFGSRQLPQSSVQRLLLDDADFDFNEDSEPLKEITDDEE